MSESEADRIKKAAKHIRLKQHQLEKKLSDGYCKWCTPWDADDYRLRWKDVAVSIDSSVLGAQVVVTGDRGYKDDKRIVIDVGEIVYLQFVPRDSLKPILETYRQFGRPIMADFTAPGLDEVINFCNKMDKEINVVQHKLRNEYKVRDVFQKLYREMGGDVVGDDDKVGKRIKYFADLVENYRQDKVQWKAEIQRHKLL